MHQLITNNAGTGALFVSYRTRRILLSLRAPYKKHSLEWSLWGGLIEKSESVKDALFRELKEEMNFISSDIVKTYPFDIYHTKNNKFSYYSFLCVVEDEFTPEINIENCGYGWFNLGIWPQNLHTGVKMSFYNDSAINRIKRILDDIHNLGVLEN